MVTGKWHGGKISAKDAHHGVFHRAEVGGELKNLQKSWKDKFIFVIKKS